MIDTLASGQRGLEGAIMRVAVLARFSSDQQEERSISDQLYDLRTFAARHGWTVVAAFEEPETKAWWPIHKRPKLMELMDRAEAREFDIVLAESLDRLARVKSVMHALQECLDFCGVEFWTVRDGRMTDLHVTFGAHVAADFGKDFGHKVRRGHSARVREGQPPPGRPPYGYRRKDGVRVKDEVEAAVVRRIYDLYKAGVSSVAITRMLNREGVPGPNGGQWNRQMILGARQGGILRNPHYVGRTVYGRRSQPRNPRSGRRGSRPNPPDEWSEGYREDLAIVDWAVWEEVQQLLASNVPAVPRRQHLQPKHLLAGLLVCGECGGNLTVKRRIKRTGVPYFACPKHDQHKGCTNPRMVQGTEIEQRVLRKLKEALLSPEVVELAVSAYREERSRRAAERAKARDSTERELRDVRRQLANVRGAIREAGHSRSLLQDLANLERREQALEANLPKEGIEVVELHPQAARRYAEIVANFGEALTKPEPERARAMTLLRSLITRVVVIPTPKGTPVGLEVVGDLLALMTVDGSARRDAASQAATIAITA